MKQSLFIEQIMVVGEGEKMPAALIQPSFEYIKEWSKEKGIKIEDTYEKVCRNIDLINAIQNEIDFHNNDFSQWEKIKKFKLTPEIWNVDDGHLTPTMKVKRKVIKEKYKVLINEIYSKV